MNIRLTALTLLSLAAALPASAQSMRPGLWEITNQMSSGDNKMQEQMAMMQKQMANMPPEQRKMMEDMMSKHGTSMPVMDKDGMHIKACLTKEMVAQNEIPVQHHGNCTHTRSPVVGGSMKFSFVCTNPESSGQGTASFSSDTAYKMNVDVTTKVQGQTRQTAMASSAKWLSGDCGNIKPVILPKDLPKEGKP
ncbi:MAG: DUF3617 domain-containing protein [Massilia sp.]